VRNDINTQTKMKKENPRVWSSVYNSRNGTPCVIW